MKSTDILNLFIPEGSYNKQEFSFGEDPRLKMDIYLPKTDNHKTPVIFVYGGAWRSGEKEDYKFVAQALVSLGHPVVIPNYRLYPKVQFPVFINDIADSIKYLEDYAKQLLKKPLEKYILMGHSAGAHAASLLTIEQSFIIERNIKSKLKGLIAISGPYDLPLDDPEVTDVFRGVSDQSANPVAIVSKKTKLKLPPILLLHGMADERVSPKHTKKFSKVLNHFGHDSTTKMYKTTDHTKIIASLGLPLRFLNNSFKDVSTFLSTLQ